MKKKIIFSIFLLSLILIPTVYALPQKSSEPRTHDTEILNFGGTKEAVTNYYVPSPTTVIPRTRTQALHVNGNRIVDASGNTVYLRGWNKPGANQNAIVWGGGSIYNRPKVDTELDRMKSYGANVVRYLITAHGWIDNTNVVTESGTIKYRAAIEDLLTRAEARGMYVIVCYYSIYTADCPVHSSGCDFQDNGPYDPYTTDGHEGVVPNAAAFSDFIANIVAVLGAHDNLIIEPFNEVFPGYTGASYAARWQTDWNSCISKVRQVESAKGYNTHLILCQLGCNIVSWSLTDPCVNFNWFFSYPLTDPKHALIYGQHIYNNHMGTDYLGVSEDYASLKAFYMSVRMDDVAAQVPLLISEFGACAPYDSSGSEYNFLKNSLQIFNDWGIHYTAFSWWDTGSPFDEIERNSESTGGTLNRYGQLVANALQAGG